MFDFSGERGGIRSAGIFTPFGAYREHKRNV
jgi:hypothetical protein